MIAYGEMAARMQQEFCLEAGKELVRQSDRDTLTFSVASIPLQGIIILEVQAAIGPSF